MHSKPLRLTKDLIIKTLWKKSPGQLLNSTAMRFMACYSRANEKAKTLKVLTAPTSRGKNTHTSANSDINTGKIEILFSQKLEEQIFSTN